MISSKRKHENNRPFQLTKKTRMSDVALESPRTAELLNEYGLHCMNCLFNRFDTVETGAKLHGMTEAQIQEMIKEINTLLRKELRQ